MIIKHRINSAQVWHWTGDYSASLWGAVDALGHNGRCAPTSNLYFTQLKTAIKAIAFLKSSYLESLAAIPS
ncbi:hypothetical protein [Tolypothrix sp. VBCCA 56010]|uniref:hypothetical protein n=1 Tax=Tolypothrix sp. VBCCA 56010 TaxID=3137731 RepID=UPI003D7EBC62